MGPGHIIFQDKTYDFELRRTLGYTLTGGSDINECLETAMHIKEGDEESWYAEWGAWPTASGALGRPAWQEGTWRAPERLS